MTGPDARLRHLVNDTTLWGMREISANLNYSYQTVRVMRAAGQLPEPDATPSGRPVWYAGTIRRWAIDSRRMDHDGKVRHLQRGRPPGSKTKRPRP